MNIRPVHFKINELLKYYLNLISGIERLHEQFLNARLFHIRKKRDDTIKLWFLVK